MHLSICITACQFHFLWLKQARLIDSCFFSLMQQLQIARKLFAKQKKKATTRVEKNSKRQTQNETNEKTFYAEKMKSESKRIISVFEIIFFSRICLFICLLKGIGCRAYRERYSIMCVVCAVPFCHFI